MVNAKLKDSELEVLDGLGKYDSLVLDAGLMKQSITTNANGAPVSNWTRLIDGQSQAPAQPG